MSEEIPPEIKRRLLRIAKEQGVIKEDEVVEVGEEEEEKEEGEEVLGEIPEVLETDSERIIPEIEEKIRYYAEAILDMPYKIEVIRATDDKILFEVDLTSTTYRVMVDGLSIAGTWNFIIDFIKKKSGELMDQIMVYGDSLDEALDKVFNTIVSYFKGPKEFNMGKVALAFLAPLIPIALGLTLYKMMEKKEKS